MRILNEVTFDEVLSCHNRENLGSKSFGYTAGRLRMADTEVGAKWTLVILSREDILSIMLPPHKNHDPEVLIPDPGSTVSVVAGNVRELTRETGRCWENIYFHKNIDFSQTHIFLKCENGRLKHLDGLHRLLAWVVFEKNEEMLAYVAGVTQ
jgi:hypothetical protein